MTYMFIFLILLLLGGVGVEGLKFIFLINYMGFRYITTSLY